MIAEDRLQKVLDRFEAVQSEMNSNVERERFVALSKEFAELSPVADAVRALRQGREDRMAAQEMMADIELAPMAREVIERLGE